jgi:hypothetical protein
MLKENINKKLDKIIPKISKDDFLEMKGLANEIAFYIFDYEPKEEKNVEEHIPKIIKHFNYEGSRRKIIQINLYEILIKNLKKDNILEKIFEIQKNTKKEQFYEMLKNYARKELFTNEIKTQSIKYDIIFITGVSHIYPVIKSHELLTKLHEEIGDRKPVVLFYPGKFTGDELTAFHKNKKHNYYRARPLVD